MKKKTLFSKSLNPFAKQFIIATAFLITSVFSFLIACKKAIDENNRIHDISFPIFFQQEDCPYPPGCNSRLNEIATSQYHALDTFAVFKVNGNKINIATKDVAIYGNVKSFRFTENRLIPELK